MTQVADLLAQFERETAAVLAAEREASSAVPLEPPAVAAPATVARADGHAVRVEAVGVTQAG
jgi:hypothetical protein